MEENYAKNLKEKNELFTALEEKKTALSEAESSVDRLTAKNADIEKQLSVGKSVHRSSK